MQQCFLGWLHIILVSCSKYNLPEQKTRILSPVNEYIDNPFIQISVLGLNFNFSTQTAYYFTLPTGFKFVKA